MQYQCCSWEHLWVVVDLKRRYKNIRNEWMNEYLHVDRQTLALIKQAMQNPLGHYSLGQCAWHMKYTGSVTSTSVTWTPVESVVEEWWCFSAFGQHTWPMFPLSCAWVHVQSRTQAVRQAHTRKLGAHINVPSKNVFAHISYTSFQIHMMSVGKMWHEGNFMHTQTLKNYREHCMWLSC